ncbi:hypothetical protein C4564_00465 [Candidatus Microgenomates bacterium]|nr:MAG: hypothetical protein C4564_00465 [Candidatus Microgenomates bacterium]
MKHLPTLPFVVLSILVALGDAICFVVQDLSRLGKEIAMNGPDWDDAAAKEQGNDGSDSEDTSNAGTQDSDENDE